MRIYISGIQRSGSTFYYSKIYNQINSDLDWSIGNNLLTRLAYQDIIPTNEDNKERFEFVKQHKNFVFKMHHQYQIAYVKKYGIDWFNKYYDLFDETHLIVRRNTFELVLSNIMWKLSNQHGDDVNYQIENYPTVNIPVEYFDLICNDLKEQTLNNWNICKQHLKIDKLVYYEDLQPEELQSNRAPSKNKYVSNYESLKDKRGNLPTWDFS